MKNVNENGRSMVEMLGVLAIIGVLSVGGIAGYTRAMNNWKANEIIDAMNRVVVATETDTSRAASTTYTDLGGVPGNIAGGLVSEITGVRNNGGASVTVTWATENDDVIRVIKEKLGCENGGDCHIGADDSLYTANVDAAAAGGAGGENAGGENAGGENAGGENAGGEG